MIFTRSVQIRELAGHSVRSSTDTPDDRRGQGQCTQGERDLSWQRPTTILNLAPNHTGHSEGDHGNHSCYSSYHKTAPRVKKDLGRVWPPIVRGCDPFCRPAEDCSVASFSRSPVSVLWCSASNSGDPFAPRQ